MKHALIVAVLMMALPAMAMDSEVVESGTNAPPEETWDRIVIDTSSVVVSGPRQTYTARAWFAKDSIPVNVTMQPDAEGVTVRRDGPDRRLRVTVTFAEIRSAMTTVPVTTKHMVQQRWHNAVVKAIHLKAIAAIQREE